MTLEVTGIDVTKTFKTLGILSHEVMMEQMSKSGSFIQGSMRSFMGRATTLAKTRVGIHGAYLEYGDSREFGLRESMQVDNHDMTPKSMQFAINSFLMEKSSTLVVGGAHPSFTPIKRREGRIVGVMGRIGSVGTQTMAILHRMETGEERGDYPTRTQLSKNIRPSSFLEAGINSSKGSVKVYLEEGWAAVMKNAVNHMDTETIRRRYG